MASKIDQIVDILRDEELIKWSIIQRMELNPKIREETAKSILSDSQTLLQKHEIKRLLTKYKSDNDQLLHLLQSSGDSGLMYGDPNVDMLLLNFKDLIEESDNKAIQMLSTNGEEDKSDNIYNMMTSGNKTEDGLTNVQSLYTSDIHLSNMFTNAEEYGSHLDLHPLFNEWLQLPRKTPLDIIPTYFQYMKGITKRDTNLKLDQITGYLSNLEEYLHSFWINTNPLEDDVDFSEDKFDTCDQKELICLVCNIKFTKEGPMDNHMKSKKHLNKCKLPEIQSILKSEYRIKTLISNLKPIYDSTVSEVERVNLLTTREWQLEQNDKQQPKSPSLIPVNVVDQLENPDQAASLSSSKSEIEKIDDNPLNLPLGPDGKPIPYWLFKMKGLRREFKCEICGNKSYRGRGVFSSHFQSKRHIDGLKMIGVLDGDYHIFDDLSTIDDVKNLLEERSNEKIRERKFEVDVEQIEVDNGDVLSKKVYNQLQKQGLI